MNFFFLRLPFDHHGPVSELSRSNLYTQSCTGPLNWGEAHCAGEKVKQTRRTIKKTRFQPARNSGANGCEHGGSGNRAPHLPAFWSKQVVLPRPL